MRSDRSRTAGIGTYGISGLRGGILAALADSIDSASVLVAGFPGFALRLRLRHSRQDLSVTGAVTGLGVFSLGTLAVSGDYRAVAAAGDPRSRPFLQAVKFSRAAAPAHLDRIALSPGRSLMITTILPLLPKHGRPRGGLNLWEIWFFPVLTAAISFLE